MTSKKNITVVWLTIILPSVFSFCYFGFFVEQSSAQILYSITRVLLVLLPIAWIMLVDKDKFPFVRFKKDGLLAGVLSGLIIGASLIALYFLFFKNILDFTMLKYKATQLGFSGTNFIFLAIFITIINSSIEEYYWRWFAFTKLRNVVSSRKAILISAFGFSFHHIIVLISYFGIPFGMLFSFGVFLGGLIWAYFYDKYDSILPCIVSHLIIDAAVMAIGYDIIFG